MCAYTDYRKNTIHEKCYTGKSLICVNWNKENYLFNMLTENYEFLKEWQ